MPNDHKVIYTAATPQQAHLLADALRSQGILSYVTNESLQTAGGDLPVWLSTAAACVVVHEEDADEARQIALDFDKAMQEGVVPAGFADLEDEREEEAAWPVCPDCHRRRHTSCPTCGTAGSIFPQAFMLGDDLAPEEEAGDTSSKLLICPACDEPFVPEFLARCEWCGHPFADGRQGPPMEEPAESDFNGRVAFMIVALVVFVAGVLAFFAYIASGH